MKGMELREAIMSGRYARPDEAELGRFLSEDRGALTWWFGPDAAGWGVDRLRARADRDIARLDELIGAALDAVLHHPRLQRLEGSWRGLASLACGFEPGSRVKVSVMSASWRELDADFARAIEFDQSNLFRFLYENEFGRAGGEPFGLLVVDHEIRHQPAARTLADPGAPVDDVSVAAELASVAAAAFIPVVLAASPSLLGADRFEDLALSHAIADNLADEEHRRWRLLAAREEARFLCVTMPHVLARPRWSSDRSLPFYEEYAPTAADRPWSVACYAFAATVIRAQLAHGWPADVRGVPSGRVGGGLVLDLAEEEFVLGAETRWARASTDLGLTDRQERDLVLAGLMPLNTLPGGGAAFGSVRSLQTRINPAPGRDPTAYDANRRLSAEISAVLCVSRFAHYVKVIGREITGKVTTPEEIERRLQDWLRRYTNASSSPDAATRARYPLLSSRVEVREQLGRPGSFGCIIHLQPHYQIDDVSTVFRLVTGFTAPGASEADARTGRDAARQQENIA